jgi:hypothetical protein
VSWVGNDGTFSSPSTVTVPGTLPVHVVAGSAGIHSALLRLDDPASPGYEYEVLNTVVAAEQFPASTDSISDSGTPDLADKKSFFVNVGAGVQALQFTETIASGRTRLDLVDPYGDPVVLNADAPCGCVEDYATAPATQTLSLPNPMPGVWEIDIEASRSAPTPTSSTSFTVAELGVTVSPALVQSTGTTTTAYTFRNDYAAFTGSAVGAPLGSAFRDRQTATAPDSNGDAFQFVPIQVPAGATSLHVAIGNPDQPQTDLDLYLFDPSGNLVTQSASSTPNEQVTVSSPVAGQWVAAIDDFAVGGTGTTQYDYSDLIAEPGLGSITTTDTPAAHAIGSTWSADATATPAGDPGAGRFWLGYLNVVSGGAVVGRGEIDLLP